MDLFQIPCADAELNAGRLLFLVGKLERVDVKHIIASLCHDARKGLLLTVTIAPLCFIERGQIQERN